VIKVVPTRALFIHLFTVLLYDVDSVTDRQTESIMMPIVDHTAIG